MKSAFCESKTISTLRIPRHIQGKEDTKNTLRQVLVVSFPAEVRRVSPIWIGPTCYQFSGCRSTIWVSKLSDSEVAGKTLGLSFQTSEPSSAEKSHRQPIFDGCWWSLHSACCLSLLVIKPLFMMFMTTRQNVLAISIIKVRTKTEEGQTSR